MSEWFHELLFVKSPFKLNPELNELHYKILIWIVLIYMR